MSANQQVSIAISSGEPTGQALFTSSAVWVCPPGVTSVSVVCVGAGGNSAGGWAAAGGALAYKNNVAVTPGISYTIVVGTPQAGYGISTSAFGCVANGATSENKGGTPQGTYNGGGAGGDGGGFSGGGGGAGGYSGKGGNGDFSSGGAGQGGAGGGGCRNGYSGYCGYGGGVGVYGMGASGAASTDTSYTGKPGSGGSGNSYGGGGASTTYTEGGGGAVRIIWPGNLRQFPSTRTADE